MKEIKIFDTTLRDGEQSPGCSMTVEEKVLFAKQLEKLNVDVIEAGFAASSSNDLTAIQEISKCVFKPVIVSLARLTKNDIDKAYESLKYAKRKRIHVFIATSDIHLKDKLHMSREEVLIKIRKMVKYAKNLCSDIEFSLEDATRTDKDFMVQVIDVAIRSGANVINIPDTVGIITPFEFRDLINFIKSNVANIDRASLSVHCHNDLGLAVSNTLAAIDAGIDQIECTVNGIGERAGNCALEEVVMALKVRSDYYNTTTNIVVGEIVNSSRMLTKITGSVVQNNKPVVGANAFKHEAGIHQQGVIGNSKTYEIMDRQELGIVEDNIVIGIHSGKHAIMNKLNSLGIGIEESEIDYYVAKIKDYLGDHKTISDQELISIINDGKIKKLK